MPEMEPTLGAGWTAHNIEVRRQYTAFLELEIVGGGMDRDEVDGFLAEVSQTVEANDGEAKRVAAEATAAAEANVKALTYKAALQQQSIKEALNIGKGKGKGNSSFPSDTKPGRFTAIPHTKTSDEVRAITALSGRAHAALDEAQQQQAAAAGNS